MLAHDFASVAKVRLQGLAQSGRACISRAQSIASGYRYVAQPAHMAYAADGTSFGTLQKRCFAPRQ